jgi:acetyl-CoA carboxylase biotin carboxyl carrier protein
MMEQVSRTKESPVRKADASGPFTLDEVKALVEVLEGTDVTSLVWDRNGQKVAIRRGAPAGVTQVVHHAAPAPAAPVAAAAPAPAPAAAPPKAADKPGHVVTAPLVGTFYRAASPESAPYVEVGTIVKKGQVLCIVEAMKLMNEIEAEVGGLVAEIFIQNGTPVEFGQPLFRIEPA